MLITLLKQWRENGTYVDNNGVDYGRYHAADRWDFDTTTLAVVFTAFPNGGSFQQEENLGQGAPEDESRPVDEEFHVSAQGPTRTGYYHDGLGGFTTDSQTITVTATVIGCDCWGAAAGLIDHTLGADSPAGDYTYLWNDGVTMAARTQLRVGTYSVTTRHESGAQLLTGGLVVGQNARLLVVVETIDGRVRLRVSGGTAPYTYRWSDGVTTAERADLGAGEYSCVVTDALGCTAQAAVNATARADYYFSRNPIPLRLDAGDDYRADPSTLPNLTFVCQVLVEQEYLSDEFTAVGTELEQPADAQGRTAFQVQELLAPYLDYHVPPASGAVAERATALFKRFFLRHAQVSGTPPTKGARTGADQFYVVLGGLSFTEAQARTWFTAYQPTVQPFLSWEANDKWVLDDQPEFLYFQALAPAAVAEVVVAVDLADGAQRVVVLAELTQLLRYEIYCLGVGFGQGLAAGLSAAERVQVLGWQVWVRDADGVALSEIRRYYLERQRPAQVRYLLYGNSLGGMNTFVATGEAQQDAEVTGDQVELSLPLDYDPLRGDTAVLERELRPVLNLASGVRLGRAEHLGLQELLLSRRVLLLNAGRWLAGYVKTKTVNVVDEGKRVPTLEVDFVLPSERQFTPYLPPAATVAVGPDSGAL